MTLFLEPITQSLNYGDLPETWRVPDINHFSTEKTLYDYQANALRNAARALYLYYGKADNNWSPGETLSVKDKRKRSFSDLYKDAGIPHIQKYETRTDRNNDKQSPVFRILADYIRPCGDEIL